MGEWVDVEIQMPPFKDDDPDQTEDVLIYAIGHGGYVRMLTAFYLHSDEEWYTDEGDPVDEHVTHWTDLPDPPI